MRWNLAIMMLFFVISGCAVEEDSGKEGETEDKIDIQSITEPIENEIPSATTVAKDGLCSKDNIRNEVNRRKNRLRQCYEIELDKDLSLEGKMKVRWTINAEGKVEEASTLLSTMDNEEVEKCVLAQIKQMHFEKPKNGSSCVVNWPFVFSSIHSIENAAIFANGLCDEDDLRGAVQRHTKPFRDCYEIELGKDPSLKGKMEVRWTINAGGIVEEASIESSTMDNEEVEKCVLAQIERIRFEKPQNGGSCVVNWPLVFSSE